MASRKFGEVLAASSLGPAAKRSCTNRFGWAGDVLEVHFDTGSKRDVAELERNASEVVSYRAKLDDGKARSFGMRTTAVQYCETHAKRIIAQHVMSCNKAKK